MFFNKRFISNKNKNSTIKIFDFSFGFTVYRWDIVDNFGTIYTKGVKQWNIKKD